MENSPFIQRQNRSRLSHPRGSDAFHGGVLRIMQKGLQDSAAVEGGATVE